MNRFLFPLVLLLLAGSANQSRSQNPTGGQPAAQAETIPKATSDAPIRKKLREIVIPSIDLQDTPLSAVVSFLNSKSIELDHASHASGDDPFGGGDTKSKPKATRDELRGVNIVVLTSAIEDSGALAEPFVTAKFTDIPLGEAIKLIAQLSACKVRVDRHAVVLIPLKPGEAPEFAADDPKLIARQREQLSSIILPSVEFVDTPFRHALEFITQKMAELVSEPLDPPLNLILRSNSEASDPFGKPKFPPTDGGGPTSDLGDTAITLKLRQIPVLDALQYTVTVAGCELVIGNTMVIIQPVAAEQQNK